MVGDTQGAHREGDPSPFTGEETKIVGKKIKIVGKNGEDVEILRIKKK